MSAVHPQEAFAVPASISSPAVNADVVLELRHLTKHYARRRGQSAPPAVEQVSLKVRRGEVLCLMGTSGSGKSTLLRHINRLIEPSSGEVLIDGSAISQLSARELRTLRSRRIGMVFQHFGLLPHRSVRDNVALPLELRGEPEALRHAAADVQLQAMGLEGWGDHYPHELSGGMQQRVGLARALVSEPDILLMDEPFSALDPTIRRDLQSHFLQVVRERGITTLLVTHDPAEALRLADRIAVLRHGQLIQVGTPEELLKQPADAEVADFFQEHGARSATPVATIAPRKSATTPAPVNPGLSSAQALLLGPAALAASGRGGLYWLGFALELGAAAALGQGLATASFAWAALALIGLLLSRLLSLALARRPSRLGRSDWRLPWLVLLLSQVLVLWRVLATDASGPWLQFPADRQVLLGTAAAIDQLIAWSQVTFESTFVGVIVAVRTVIESIESLLGWLPWPVPALALVLLAWRSAGAALALTSAAALLYIGLFGFWERTIATLALVGSSVLISLLIGVPAGILLAKRALARRLITPLLDVMQTLPTFVYLIPAVAFFSVGKTPAVIATVIFALAPMIRLTALGIQEVPKTAVEAALAHGATPWQILTKVELPLAAGSLLLGINQTLVMSLSMVVVAALIGAGGLGYDVMTALRNIKGGEGMLAGAAIVFCALIPDRIIQATLRQRDRTMHQS
ncbi:ATP-binding cassette domain-containing protein [Pseudomonas protegens]|uniref:Glycine betaine transport ATP-binding protein OpuAA n=1 Tax=Pseudomonas protegens (strain DSM 19095 / LMG 27888 / CFBP 6595 / CHA0) TaxID=1124983 RepID=A0A2C9EL55_PSEPH|nr:ATP-binding cassette domain-containing protein [Pseudomonas protegens]AGL84387.1 glycine betaine transport ATP-binding protein OpuAA [Pseudomonas protegens CHA0]QTU24173.1 ATP-binding cassette domain-containing protein [Pseudomonas protegens]QTU33704.1 ATP-binding cassette domain-containing protein [Pseudomonas protegens]RLO24221.1 ATP-binding cassette domain-containing protein [Pseudomonas protegens]VAV68896.1 glycine betaine transport ATP-binding protein OpuAA [Pseudomonas protegens CHA0]